MTHLLFVHSDGLNIRNRPSANSDIVGSVAHGAKVELDRQQIVHADGFVWRRVQTRNEEWIAQSNLSTGEQFLRPEAPGVSSSSSADTGLARSMLDEFSKVEVQTPETEVLVVNTGILNVRNAPRLLGDVIERFRRSQEVEVYSNVRQIGERGWVWRQLVGEDPPRWAAEVNQETGLRLLRPKDKGVNGRVRIEGTHFNLDGRSLRFIGANMRELAYYGQSFLPHATPNHRETQLKAARDLNMRVIRFYAAHRHVSVAQSIALVRETLDRLHEHGLLGIVCLNDSVGLSNYYVPGDDHFHTVDAVKHPDRIVYYRNGGWRQNLLPFIEHIVGALRDHPAIFAWELGNEYALVPHPGTKEDGDAFIDFAHQTAQSIRSLDDQHLITTGLVNVVHVLPQGEKHDAFARRLYESPEIDFGTVHFYQSPNQSHEIEPLEEQRSRVDLQVLKSLAKPMIIEEFGSAFGCFNRFEFTRDNLSEWFGLGIAGFMQWGFSATPHDIGVGDSIWGMDSYSTENGSLYQPFANLYREWALRLENQG